MFLRKTPLTQNNLKEWKSISTGARTLKYSTHIVSSHKQNVQDTQRKLLEPEFQIFPSFFFRFIANFF